MASRRAIRREALTVGRAGAEDASTCCPPRARRRCVCAEWVPSGVFALPRRSRWSGDSGRDAAPARPKGPPTSGAVAGADPLQGYAGRVLILRGRGDAKSWSIKREQLTEIRGGCHVVVHVKQAQFDRGTARFTVEMLGRPRTPLRGARDERCEDDQPQTLLTVSGFAPGTSAQELESAFGGLLQTPEMYLRGRGVAYDDPLPAAPTNSPKAIASPTPDFLLTQAPERLLWADVITRDPARKIHHEGEVEVRAVVGSDGQLYDPELRTSLSEEHEERVRRLLKLWRYRPARRGAEPVSARVDERMVFRIY